MFVASPFQTTFSRYRRRAVVAIPAKDEAERLPACLHALGAQTRLSGTPLPKDAFSVIILANNCSDDTAEIARRAAETTPCEIRVVEAKLPASHAHAGGARRAAMDLAEARLRELGADDGVILTTDADSRVSPTWVCANLEAFAQGADAVLGWISLDEDGEKLPPALHARGKLESVYEALLTEISARLDPQDANPWPHHATISAATLGVTRAAYLRIGGMPRVPLGEDKAIVAALRLHDARIRFAPEVTVTTSGRVFGRAPGGVADTLRLRSEDPTALCDEALEPCAVAFRRALWRGRMRRQGLLTFGAAWDRIERASPALTRRRLAPADLPNEIEKAMRALRWLQERLLAGENVEPVSVAPLAFDHIGEALSMGDKAIGGLISG